MGQIISCRCDNCGFEKDLFIGVGMAAKNIGIIERLFPAKIFKDLSSAMENGRVRSFRAENKAAVCDECKRLVTVPMLTYTLYGDEDVNYVHNCPECGSNAVTTYDTENLSCPRCGGAMQFETVGHWD